MSSLLKKYQTTLAVCTLLLASASVYLNILPNPFIWSEEAVIVKNPTYKDLSYLPKFFTVNYWLNEDPFSATQMFRPIRAVTFTLEYALWELNPVPYHLFNIFLHTATTLLVFLIIKKITQSFSLGFLTALFFAVHPAHTETVTWTMSRDDIMCTLFPLAAWWFFLKRVGHPEEVKATKGSKRGRMTLFYLFLEMFFFTLGLLSREMAAVFPLLLVFFVITFYPAKKWRSNLLATLPYWLIDFIYVFVHFYFWREDLSAERFSIKLPYFNHTLLVGKTIGFYLKLLLSPINLCADHFFPLFVTLAEPETQTLVALFLLFASLTLYFLSKNQKKLFFSLAFTLFAFLPVANIIIVTGRPVGEQRLYLPSIGFCLFLALVFQRLRKKLGLQIPVLAVLCLIGFYSFKTYQRNFDWRSPLSLWGNAVRVSPQGERAHHNLAGAYLDTNQEEKAILEFETLLNLQESQSAQAGIKVVHAEPRPLGALVTPIAPIANEREICEMRNQMEKEEQVRMVSPDAEIHLYLGDAYKRRDDLKRAAYEYNMAIVYDPASLHAYNSLGIIYDTAGYSEAAIAVLEKGTQIDPEFYPFFHNLGITHEHTEEYQKAIDNYDKVVKLAPDYDQPHLRLAIIYARYKIDGKKAREHWEKYLELTRHPEAKYVEEMEELLK